MNAGRRSRPSLRARSANRVSTGSGQSMSPREPPSLAALNREPMQRSSRSSRVRSAIPVGHSGRRSASRTSRPGPRRWCASRCNSTDGPRRPVVAAAEEAHRGVTPTSSRRSAPPRTPTAEGQPSAPRRRHRPLGSPGCKSRWVEIPNANVWKRLEAAFLFFVREFGVRTCAWHADERAVGGARSGC